MREKARARTSLLSQATREEILETYLYIKVFYFSCRGSLGLMIFEGKLLELAQSKSC